MSKKYLIYPSPTPPVPICISSWILCHILVMEKDTIIHNLLIFVSQKFRSCSFPSKSTHYQGLLILLPNFLPLSISFHLPYHQCNLAHHRLLLNCCNSLLPGLTPHATPPPPHTHMAVPTPYPQNILTSEHEPDHITPPTQTHAENCWMISDGLRMKREIKKL